MDHRGFITAFCVALILGPSSAYASTSQGEPRTWQRAPAIMEYAWHVNKHNVEVAATLDLPNGCYRAKLKRDIPTDPKSPNVYEVLWGQVMGILCPQIVVHCAVRSVPEFITKSYVVVVDRRGARRVPISMTAPPLPKTCPT